LAQRTLKLIKPQHPRPGVHLIDPKQIRMRIAIYLARVWIGGIEPTGLSCWKKIKQKGKTLEERLLEKSAKGGALGERLTVRGGKKTTPWQGEGKEIAKSHRKVVGACFMLATVRREKRGGV